MKGLVKFVSILMCLCLLAPAAALAEAAVPDAITPETIVATVNGAEITYADVEPWYNNFVNSYGSYYDMSDPQITRLFRSMSMENAINEKLLMQKAAENGLDVFTDEEKAQIDQEAAADWQAALDSYVSENGGITESSTDEEIAKANAAAFEYYADNGISLDVIKQWYADDMVLRRAQDMLVKDAVVSDEELSDRIDEITQADKEMYQNDVRAFEEYQSYVDQMAMYSMYYGGGGNLNPPMYKPAGYRAVKHILLNVDEALLSKLTDLQARLEEQASGEPSGEAETAETQAPAEPVTQEDVDKAIAEVLASVAETTAAIYQKIEDGVEFDALIEEYGSDPGMLGEPYKSAGYEVASVSTKYVPAFVSGAFSVNAVGEVSAPVVSNHGVHIIKYIGDVAEGPIALTDAQRENVRAEMLQDVQRDMFSAGLEEWAAEADIAYTGAIPSIAQLEAEENAAHEDHEDDQQEETPAE